MAFERTKGKAFSSQKQIFDRRETKSRDIKKALVHRARLRKGYFKLLEEEGETVPQRHEDEDGPQRERKPRNEQKPINFAERAKIAKERKEAARKAKLESIQERRKTLEKKGKERELKKLKLSQTTKTGQPLMGPRINNLLDKIRKDLG